MMVRPDRQPLGLVLRRRADYVASTVVRPLESFERGHTDGRDGSIPFGHDGSEASLGLQTILTLPICP